MVHIPGTYTRCIPSFHCNVVGWRLETNQLKVRLGSWLVKKGFYSVQELFDDPVLDIWQHTINFQLPFICQNCKYLLVSMSIWKSVLLCQEGFYPVNLVNDSWYVVIRGILAQLNELFIHVVCGENMRYLNK